MGGGLAGNKFNLALIWGRVNLSAISLGPVVKSLQGPVRDDVTDHRHSSTRHGHVVGTFQLTVASDGIIYGQDCHGRKR